MNHDQSGSLEGVMRSLNLDLEDIPQDFSSMSYPQLAEAKTKIEDSLNALFSLLQDVYKFDMESPLTRDGYPRNDIDVVSIRLVRTKIIRLRNDHSKVMNYLGSILSSQLQRNTEVTQNDSRSYDTPVVPAAERYARVPFASVRTVAPRSPAESAGMQVGDRLTIFDGDINATNHKKLSEIAARVQAKEGKHIEVVVLRDTTVLTLDLVPRSWEGRGLLGCHVVPL